MNLLKLNHTTDTGNYNCGGFALGNHEWYIPESLNYSDAQDSHDSLIEDAVADILNDFPNLKRIPSPKAAPKNKDLVGFRLAISMNDDGEFEEEDFHFVLRHRHRWYHKPGGSPIKRVDFNMEHEWFRLFGTNYNSRIVWFVKESA